MNVGRASSRPVVAPTAPQFAPQPNVLILMRRKPPRARRACPQSGTGKGLLGALAAATAAGAIAVASVLFLLRPTWPGADMARDAPSLPVSVAGVIFNVPPAAIRVPAQRRAGAQPRLDLAFTWPGLVPPPVRPAKLPPGEGSSAAPEQIFITVTGARDAVPLNKRITEIYARFAASEAFRGPEGLLGVAFKDGTPYSGEDLLFEAERPEDFVARCTRDTGQTPGTCLLERHIGAAEITVRFRRAWLAEWQALAGGVERLLATLHGPES